MIRVSFMLDKQSRHVRVAFLGAQVKRREACFGFGVGLCTVLQQCRGYVHLQTKQDKNNESTLHVCERANNSRGRARASVQLRVLAVDELT